MILKGTRFVACKEFIDEDGNLCVILTEDNGTVRLFYPDTNTVRIYYPKKKDAE